MDDNIRKTKQELSIQKWKQLIEDFNNSDMTLSEWCDSNHVGKAQEMYDARIKTGLVKWKN